MAAPEHDWYLHAWFDALGKIQNDLHTELKIPKNSMNRLWHGEQRYRKDHINLISDWLHIQPYELLMHPKDAFRIRRLEATVQEEARRAAAISQSTEETPTGEAPTRRKAG